MDIRQALRDFASGLANQVTRGKLALAYYSQDGQRTMVQLTGLAGETHTDVELLLPYGMSAMPGAKTGDLLVLQVNANRDHKVALACDDPAQRIAGLGPGEFGFRFNGQQVVFRSGQVEITTTNAGQKLLVSTAGDCDITSTGGNVNVTGTNIVLAGGGPAVARVGDAVTCPAGTGHITSGSAKVTSG